MPEEEEQVIEEFLEGKPRAAELAEMAEALEVRRQNFERERSAAKEEARRKEWSARVKEVEEQIRVLREEQAITDFVENSIRATVNRPQIDPDLLD